MHANQERQKEAHELEQVFLQLSVKWFDLSEYHLSQDHNTQQQFTCSSRMHVHCAAGMFTDLITRFDLKGAEIKHQISSNMWVSSEGRTAYVYVKTDWQERQKLHRKWLRQRILAPQLHQQAKKQQLLRHVSIQQQLVLQQLQREEEPVAAAAKAAAAAGEPTQKTPRSSRRSSMSSAMDAARCRSSSRRRQSTAGEALQQQQQQQDMVLFHLAARRQQLHVLEHLEPGQSIWENLWGQHNQSETDADNIDDKALLEQLHAFRSTHFRLSKW